MYIMGCSLSGMSPLSSIRKMKWERQGNGNGPSPFLSCSYLQGFTISEFKKQAPDWPKNNRELWGSKEFQRTLVPFHFTNEENEVQRRKLAEPRVHNEVESETGSLNAETLSTSGQKIKCIPLGLPCKAQCRENPRGPYYDMNNKYDYKVWARVALRGRESTWLIKFLYSRIQRGAPRSWNGHSTLI